MSTIGGNIDALWELREKKRALEAEVKLVHAEMEELEFQIIEAMDREGTTTSAATKASVSISESLKPSVEDWDAFYAYLHRHKAYHLLERRPSVTGCRELFETKGKIPGVVPFKKRALKVLTK